MSSFLNIGLVCPKYERNVINRLKTKFLLNAKLPWPLPSPSVSGPGGTKQIKSFGVQ